MAHRRAISFHIAILLLSQNLWAERPLVDYLTPVTGAVSRVMLPDGPALRFGKDPRPGTAQLDCRKMGPDQGRIDFWLEPGWNGNDSRTHVLMRLSFEHGEITILKHSTYNNLIIEVRPPNGKWQGIGKEVHQWKAGERHHVTMQWSRSPTGKGTVALDIDRKRIAKSSVIMPLGALNSAVIGSPDFGQAAEALMGGFRFSQPDNLGKTEAALIGPQILPGGMAFPVIVPQPRHLQRSSGSFNLTADTIICPAGAEERRTAAFLRDSWKDRYGLTVGIDSDSAARPNAVRLSIVPGQLAQGYQLNITTTGIDLKASDSEGLFWGVQTLRQWCALDDRPTVIPCVSITDAPASSFRAHYIEAAWSYLEPAEFKRVIDALSLMKINLVAINHGDKFAYESAPRVKPVGNDKRQNTAADMRDLVAYARARHVELIPAVRAYSHAEWLTNAYPEICDNGPRKGGLRNYNPLHPQTYPLILGAIDDLLKAYDSPRYIHIGEDEHVLANIGTSPQTKDIPMGQLIGDDIARICQHLSKRNVRAMIWHDMVVPPELWTEANGRSRDQAELALSRVPKDVVICYWHYSVDSRNHPSIKYLAERGYEVLLSPWYDPANMAQLGGHLGGKVTGIMGTSWSCPWSQPDGQTWRAIVLAADLAWSPRSLSDIGYIPAETATWFTRLGQKKPEPVADVVPLAPLPGSRTSIFSYGTMDPGTAIRSLKEDCVLRGIPFRLSGAIRGAPKAKDQAETPGSGISINGSFRRLHLLMVCGEPKGANVSGQQAATVRVIYQDGATPAVIPVRYGYEIASCLDNDGVPEAQVAWRGRTASGHMCQLFMLSWTNTDPRRHIRNIELISDGGTADVVLLGVSGEK